MEDEEIKYLEALLKGIVSVPEAVLITRTTDDLGVLMSAQVDRADMGIVIGKEGAVAKAIRTIMRVVGKRHDARISLRILEPVGSSFNRPPSYGSAEHM